MQTPNLKKLYEQGLYLQCIQQTSKFLEQEPEHIDALILMARCYYDGVVEQEPLKLYQALRYNALPYLERVLAQVPSHQVALDLFLTYTLVNDHHLKHSQERKRHLNQDNQQEFLNYIDLIENKYDAYTFKIKIYDLLDEHQQVVTLLQKAMEFCDTHFEDRQERETLKSQFWMQYISVRHQNPELDLKKSLLDDIHTGLTTFCSLEEMNYLHLAEIAYESEDYVLALKILKELILYDNTETNIREGLVVWYFRLKEIEQLGFSHEDLRYYLLIIERNYTEELNIDEDVYCHHALDFTQAFPQEYAGHHFSGTYLFENKHYAHAQPVFEKALQIQLNITTWQRWVQCKYHNTQTIVAAIPPFVDASPVDLYSTGCALGEFVCEIDGEPKQELQKLTQQIYEQALQGFRDYLNNEKYESRAFNHHHHLGMCCNNLAIQYLDTQQYVRGIPVIEEGLAHTEFYELHWTLTLLYENLNDQQGMYNTLSRFLKTYTEDDIALFTYLRLKHIFLVTQYQLGIDPSLDTIKDAFHSINTLEEQYADQLDESTYYDLESAQEPLQDLLWEFYEKQPISAKKEFNESILKQHPRHAWATYNLMFCALNMEDYTQLLYHAQQYLLHKSPFLMALVDEVKCHYFSMKSMFFSGQYSQACAYFLKHNPKIYNQVDATHEVQWLVYGVQAFGQCQELLQVEILVNRVEDLYAQENWFYDEYLETVQLSRAQLLYDLGKLSQAHRQLKTILEGQPHSQKAQAYLATWKKPSLLQRVLGR